MNKLKEINECEVWTNALGERFGERVCVGVDYPFCYANGQKFKPTKKEVADIWDEYIEAELGSKAQIMRDLEAEFGEVQK